MKKDQCKHFNGIGQERCAAGVNYEELAGGHELGWMYRLPCLGSYYASGRPREPKHGPRSECPKFETPNDAEIAEYESKQREFESRLKFMLPIIKRIKETHAYKTWTGKETCPICGNDLFLSHAALNGHVWGSCQTKGCLSWIE